MSLLLHLYIIVPHVLLFEPGLILVDLRLIVFPVTREEKLASLVDLCLALEF